MEKNKEREIMKLPKDGDTRQVLRWMYIPKTLHGIRKFWCWAVIKQTWYTTFYMSGNKFMRLFGKWKSERWIE